MQIILVDIVKFCPIEGIPIAIRPTVFENVSALDEDQLLWPFLGHEITANHAYSWSIESPSVNHG